MRLYLLPLLGLLLLSCNRREPVTDSDLRDLYALLDSEIARSGEYEDLKNVRIERYKQEFDQTTNPVRRTELLNALAGEFNAYNADSALYYISLNLQRPAVLATPGEYTRLLIKKADIFAHAGLFSDALINIRAIPRDSLRPELLEDYYSTYCALFQYLSEYTQDHETTTAYDLKRSTYADSLRMVSDPESFNHSVYIMAEKARNGEYDKAIKALSEELAKYSSGTREYSILASTLAYIYKTAGMMPEYKRHIVLSAISDVQGAVKENMSFREVATIMFEDGDIERANRYLKKSIADANFYSALLRNAQSAKMLPIIDDAYTSVQEQLTHRLRTFSWLSTVLSVILLLIVLYVIRQIRNVRRANASVCKANEELSIVSAELKETNRELQGKNDELSTLSAQLREINGRLESQNEVLHTFNRTKEQYAGLFMEYCSAAISTLRHYQLSLRNLAAQGANRAALLKKLESSETADRLLRNFYVKFDEAILNIYPSFVDKFNELLQPDEKIVLKSGELLNTELRLFALIRIGIDDSAKIAEFLRCSITTVYTYRSKMRKRALRPEIFESEVRSIH